MCILSGIQATLFISNKNKNSYTNKLIFSISLLLVRTSDHHFQVQCLYTMELYDRKYEQFKNANKATGLFFR
jgi:hypothetical protein